MTESTKELEYKEKVDNLFSKEIKDLLDTKIGADYLYNFLLEFLLSTRSYKRIMYDEVGKRFQQPKRSLIFAKFIFNIFNILFNNKKIKHNDILFISRYRPLKSDSDKGKEDYLFSNIIEKLDPNDVAILNRNFRDRYDHKSIDNYCLSDVIHLSDLFKTFLITRQIISKYENMRPKLNLNQKNTFDPFFKKSRIYFFSLRAIALKKIFKAAKPSVVVTNDDTNIVIKTNEDEFDLIVVQSAWLVDRKEKFRNSVLELFICEDNRSDLYCVSGPIFKKIKERHDTDTKKVTVTGQPRFDSLINKKFQTPPEFIKKAKNEGNKIFAWATQTQGLTDEENEKNILAMKCIVKDIPNIFLLIKLHPAERQQNTIYDELEKEFSNNIKIVNSKYHLYDILPYCDFLITKSSATFIEAGILKIPVLVFDFVNYKNNRLMEIGGGIPVHDLDEVVPSIKSVVNDAKLVSDLLGRYDDLVYEYNYKSDGEASKRVADLIHKSLD